MRRRKAKGEEEYKKDFVLIFYVKTKFTWTALLLFKLFGYLFVRKQTLLCHTAVHVKLY